MPHPKFEIPVNLVVEIDEHPDEPNQLRARVRQGALHGTDLLRGLRIRNEEIGAAHATAAEKLERDWPGCEIRFVDLRTEL